jgi:hypothetical protein
LAVLLSGPVAFGWERAAVTDNPNILLYWPTRTLSYYVSREGYSKLPLQEVVGAVRRSFDTWSAPSCTDVSFVYRGLTDEIETNFTRQPNEHPDYRNVIRWRESAWPPRDATIQGASSASDGFDPEDPAIIDPTELDSSVTADQLALTLLVYSKRTGKIYDADIEVNGAFFDWSTETGRASDVADIQNVVTHEVGHLLGLAHSDETEATMYGYQDLGDTTRRDLHQDDIDALCAIYPFDEVTQLGPSQPEPNLELVGRGCAIASISRTRGPPIALFLALLLVLRRRRDSRTLRSLPSHG